MRPAMIGGSTRPTPGRRPSRAEQKEGERARVREILREYPTREGRIRAWTERTAKSERAFYRRLAELEWRGGRVKPSKCQAAGATGRGVAMTCGELLLVPVLLGLLWYARRAPLAIPRPPRANE